MRKIVASILMAMDGVVENHHLWTSQFRSEESQKYKFDELFASSAADLSREGATSVFPSRYDHSRAVTTIISDSPVLAIPCLALAPNCLMLAVVISPRGSITVLMDVATLSQAHLIQPSRALGSRIPGKILLS